jgi:hypothetical protein
MAKKLIAFARKLVEFIVRIITRYPYAIALFGFVSGVGSFLLVEREQEKFAQMLSLLMLVSWLWLALENLLRRGVSSWFGISLPPPLVSFATQLVHQESLFFVIPFFFITTSWNSGQMVFTSLLIMSAVISIIDPIYYRWLAARRWLYFIFHGVTLFAVLLTALPIILQLPTPKSYLWSLVIALLLTLPAVFRALPFHWFKNLLVVVLLAAIGGGTGYFVRPWIPPATLRLTEVVITDSIDDKNRAPKNELKVVTVEQLRNGLYAYTAIQAPRGLNERIHHVWRRNGRTVDRIALDIKGGREAGYRAWSHKLNFPPNPAGRWQLQVVTEANQVIGVLRFHVVESDGINSRSGIPTEASPASREIKYRQEGVAPENEWESFDEGVSDQGADQDLSRDAELVIKEAETEQQTEIQQKIETGPEIEEHGEELSAEEETSPSSADAIESAPAQ